MSLDAKLIHVRLRADKYHVIGMPKSDAGQRTIPSREAQCPKGDLDLVFPNSEGNIEWHANIIKRGLIPPQIAAGMTVDNEKKDKEGAPILEAKYTGLHALRHFFASWCINLPQHGGLGLPPKVVQERMGHSSIMMTMDVYGHCSRPRTILMPWPPKKDFCQPPMRHKRGIVSFSALRCGVRHVFEIVWLGNLDSNQD